MDALVTVKKLMRQIAGRLCGQTRGQVVDRRRPPEQGRRIFGEAKGPPLSGATSAAPFG